MWSEYVCGVSSGSRALGTTLFLSETWPWRLTHPVPRCVWPVQSAVRSQRDSAQGAGPDVPRQGRGRRRRAPDRDGHQHREAGQGLPQHPRARGRRLLCVHGVRHGAGVPVVRRDVPAACGGASCNLTNAWTVIHLKLRRVWALCSGQPTHARRMASTNPWTASSVRQRLLLVPLVTLVVCGIGGMYDVVPSLECFSSSESKPLCGYPP